MPSCPAKAGHPVASCAYIFPPGYWIARSSRAMTIIKTDVSLARDDG
jgi:hypothetical protein